MAAASGGVNTPENTASTNSTTLQNSVLPNTSVPDYTYTHVHKGPFIIIGSLKSPGNASFQHLTICKMIYGLKGATSQLRTNELID